MTRIQTSPHEREKDSDSKIKAFNFKISTQSRTSPELIMSNPKIATIFKEASSEPSA